MAGGLIFSSNGPEITCNRMGNYFSTNLSHSLSDFQAVFSIMIGI